IGAISWNVGRSTTTFGGALEVTLAAIGGLLFADFLSGVVHWAGDTVGDESWPIVGQNFIKHFRHHHVDPKAITRHDFVETNGNNCIVSVPPLALAFWLAPDHQGAGLFISAFVGATALF